MVPDPDFIGLYEWRNGTDAYQGDLLGDLWLVPGFYFLSLEDALANYDAFLTNDRWDRRWLPLLANGGGDFMVVDCPSGGTSHGIHHFRIEEVEHPLEYRSIKAMLNTFAAAFEQGVFFLDPQGYLETIDAVFASLAATLNPDVPWWTG